MTVLDTARKAITQPYLIPGYLRTNVIWPAYTWFHRELLGRRGIEVMEEDWDNLIVLDACRYDLFESVSTFQGDLQRVISKGAATPEFLQENFMGEYHDTVYITANPSVDKHLEDEQFHAVVRPYLTHWNEEHGTVMPADMATVTEQVHDEYPDKRIIAHFIQPHQPFVGETGREIYSNSEYTSTLPDHRDDALGEDPEWDERNVFLGLFQGDLDRDAVWTAYRENLEVTLPHADHLVDVFDGKTVVTSDHGNIFKQPLITPRKPPSAHPGGIYLAPLVRVPWLSIESETRKGIVDEPPVPSEDVSKEMVSERLQDLGYIDQ